MCSLSFFSEFNLNMFIGFCAFYSNNKKKSITSCFDAMRFRLQSTASILHSHIVHSQKPFFVYYTYSEWYLSVIRILCVVIGLNLCLFIPNLNSCVFYFVILFFFFLNHFSILIANARSFNWIKLCFPPIVSHFFFYWPNFLLPDEHVFDASQQK